MNETFDFKRFWTYFKFDLKQMWRNHSRAAILIGGASAIFYVIWVMFSLVFTQSWHTPPIEARLVVFTIAFAILELYQVRTYGYLTEKKAGSSWLMVPASKAEKFVSMVLMTILVIPILFFVVYFLIDGFLSLVDPTYGKALMTSFFKTYSDLVNTLSAIGSSTGSPITFTPASLIFPLVVSTFCNFLYFLLCGICFKKNKLVSAIAILFGLSLVLSLLSGIILPSVFRNMNFDVDQAQLASWAAGFANAMTALTCILTVGLGWGVWRRIKTIQH